jgi:hypothetical protein
MMILMGTVAMGTSMGCMSVPLAGACGYNPRVRHVELAAPSAEAGRIVYRIRAVFGAGATSRVRVPKGVLLGTKVPLGG